MSSRGFIFWQDGKDWIGHLDEFPDYQTQGKTFEEKENLVDLHRDLISGEIPNVRRHAVLEIACKRPGHVLRRDCDALSAYKFSFQVRLAVLKEHPDHLAQIAL